MNPTTIELFAQFEHKTPAGHVTRTAKGWTARCNHPGCRWTDEPDGFTAGSHVDALLDHLAEDHP